jgi:hypothetical protein
MDCQIEHILGNSFIRNIIELICFLADLVGIAEGDAQHALAARFDRDHVFPRCEHDMAERDHAFLPDRLTDHGEGLPADLPVGGDVVRNVPIKFVDLTPRHELVDLDRVRASDRDALQFIASYFDVATLADLVALDDVLVADGLAGHGIELAVFDPVPGISVDLVKSDLFRSEIAGNSWTGQETRDSLR